MEMLVVLLLLTYAEKDGEFKQKLTKALEFYRENRELFLALAGEKREQRDGAENHAQNSAQKNSPPQGGEDLHVLEQFLKKI